MRTEAPLLESDLEWPLCVSLHNILGWQRQGRQALAARAGQNSESGKTLLNQQVFSISHSPSHAPRAEADAFWVPAPYTCSLSLRMPAGMWLCPTVPYTLAAALALAQRSLSTFKKPHSQQSTFVLQALKGSACDLCRWGPVELSRLFRGIQDSTYSKLSCAC
jgi:hypothetical protein